MMSPLPWLLLLQVFYEINAVNKLHEVACRLSPLESELAGLALQLLGEPVPYRLNPQVPLWTPDDVQCWLTRVSNSFSASFANIDSSLPSYRCSVQLLCPFRTVRVLTGNYFICRLIFPT